MSVPDEAELKPPVADLKEAVEGMSRFLSFPYSRSNHPRQQLFSY